MTLFNKISFQPVAIHANNSSWPKFLELLPMSVYMLVENGSSSRKDGDGFSHPIFNQKFEAIYSIYVHT